jgi:hypothetical protein
VDTLQARTTAFSFSRFLDDKKLARAGRMTRNPPDHRMNLETASTHLNSCRERMDALYQKPVFDEWVLVSLVEGKGAVLSYVGARSESFAQKLHADSAPLYAAMEGRRYEVGDFEFVQEAKGSRFDACIKAGETVYLLCNNTYGSMAELRADPRWREAQKPFVALTEKFRADPLVA